ncbi:Pdx1 protein [Saccharomycopsis crataegensis]|uniref:Dihydrolipoamide dehydrogenase-binding protein of pyruvate dehydrogenase complex n=1 Tax=Saccharomycopsis crataegensis TaxID=43959 RepID=A0AAV5QX49_9ASCO|nr:Pdx1 protein [Saccharomycopsis crataegensis]
MFSVRAFSRASTGVVRFQNVNVRLFHASVLRAAATKFGMPAMSPTMDKGGVVEWKFKEGEAYSSGDVLLEVETDKAQIDVEAQDDGILAKILLPNGSKDIPVGRTIAYLAEPEDDISKLEFPKEEATEAPKKQEPKKQEPKKPETAPKKASKPISAEAGIFNKANPSQTLFPSVSTLLESNGISKEDALEKIEATGPNGRLLKGDVLFYLGKISKESAGAIATYFKAHEKLDLSNIQGAPIKAESSDSATEAKSSSDAAVPAKPSIPEPKVIKQSFDLSSIVELREASLGKVKPFTIYEFVSEAVKKSQTYALQRHPVKSDFYDDLFEDIISIPSRVDRFKVNFKINQPESKVTPSVGQPSIFDLLTEVKSAPSTESHETPTVEVELVINEQVADAEEKAKLFMKKFDEFVNVT